MRQKPSTCRVEPNMAAELDAIITIAKFRDLDRASELILRINWHGRQIAGEDVGTLRPKEKHISRFNTHRRLALDAEPAIALHYGEEFDFVRRRKADGPGASSLEATHHKRLS